MDTFFPEEHALQALAKLPDDVPVVMLNLLRFAPGGGAKAYGRYAGEFLKLLADLGGRLLYQGRAEQLIVGAGQWHQVLLVQYPSRKAFIDMFHSEAYRDIHRFRDEGLAATILYALRTLQAELP